MSHPIVTSLTIIAGSATLLAASQSLGAAGPLTLVSTATLDVPRQIGITSAGNDSGIKWTVTGTARTEQGGAPLVETITGANVGVATTTQNFATVTSIVGSGATASTVTAGTTGTASGPWVPWDMFVEMFQVQLQGNVLSGSPTYQVDVTSDDVFGLWLPAGVTFPRATTLQNFSGLTANAMGQITGAPVKASRLTLTAYGGVSLTQQQTGN